MSFESNKVEYGDLVHFFYRTHDPTNLKRQGNDRGTQSGSVIFAHTNEQQKIAE